MQRWIRSFAQRARLIQDIRSVLTPDQIQRLAQTDDEVVSAKIGRMLFRLARLDITD